MPRSLRARLLLAVGVVVVLSVAAVGLLSTSGTRREIEQFLEVETRESSEAMPDMAGMGERLEAFHHHSESWQGVGPLLQELREASGGTHHLLLMGPDGDLLLATSSRVDPGSVVALPDGGLQIDRTRREDGELRAETARIRGPRVELRDGNGNRVGSLHLMPELPEIGAAPREGRLLRSINRWLWLVAIAAGILALAATAAVGQRILGPVEQLTRAARRMAGGDLGHRVPVASQDEVGELARAFNQMAEGLQRQERLRRQMVTDVAHDLRTPLTNIRGQLEAIQDGLLEPTPEIVASLHEEVLFLTGLVGDLQDLSLAEAGNLRLQPRSMLVAPEIERVREALRPAGISGGPAVEIAIPDLPPVLADPVRFRQVVRNLLANALAHTPAAGRVRIEACDRGAQVEVTVRDDGPGIPPEHLPHVFERFYRVDASRARETGGAGLGLAIVKHLVRAQGGQVHAESRPGEGAVFSFTVPKAAGEGAVPASNPPESSRSPGD